MMSRWPSNLNFSMIFFFYFSDLVVIGFPALASWVHSFLCPCPGSLPKLCMLHVGRGLDLLLAARRALGSVDMAPGSCLWSGFFVWWCWRCWKSLWHFHSPVHGETAPGRGFGGRAGWPLRSCSGWIHLLFLFANTINCVAIWHFQCSFSGHLCHVRGVGYQNTFETSLFNVGWYFCQHWAIWTNITEYLGVVLTFSFKEVTARGLVHLQYIWDVRSVSYM